MNLPPPRGVLRPQIPEAQFQHQRQAPCAELSNWIEHFWFVAWDVQDAEATEQTTLPHPNVHLVIEQGEARIWGVQSDRFTRRLHGKQSVFGIKFRAGGFYHWLGQPVASIHNQQCTVPANIAPAAEKLTAAVSDKQPFSALCLLAEQMFLSLLPQLPNADPALPLLQKIMQEIVAQPELNSVEDLQKRYGIHKRQLQRLFQQYVGVSPKWVIQRYRLHEAIARIQTDELINWSRLAQDLGYFDQAHFIRAFRVLTGMTPAAYQDFLRKA